MATQTTYPLSLNGDTFNALKSDYDALLRQLLTEMENRNEEEATITIKVGVKLEKDQARDFEVHEYEAMRDIVKPTFKHEISTVMQIKNKKSGSLGGTMELVWDKELCQYVMRPIDNGQVTLYDTEGSDIIPMPEPPALPTGTVIDAEFRVLGDGNEAWPSAFEYLRQFVGHDMKVEVTERGVYNVRTENGKVILSSGFSANDSFYCSAEKLESHVGHVVSCVSYGQDEIFNISIECEECNEVLFDIDADDSDEPADYPYEEPGAELGEE